MANSFFSLSFFEMADSTMNKTEFKLTRTVPDFKPMNSIFTVLGCIGCGSYGQVYKVKIKGTDDVKALKLLEYKPEKDLSYSVFLDVCIPLWLKHPNIIQVEDIKFITFEGRKYIGIVMECLRMDIFKCVNMSTKRFGPSKVNIELMYNMTRAIARLNLNGVIHSDIKDLNFVVNVGPKGTGASGSSGGDLIPGSVKLIDFGLAQKSEDHFLVCKNMYTYINRPPEILFPTIKRYSEKADVWALGCVFYTILFGHHPFCPLSITQERRVISNIFSLRGNPKDECPDILHSVEWDKFYSTHYLDEHKWVRKNLFSENFRINSLLEGMLELDPDKRLSISGVVSHPLFEDFFNPQDLDSVPSSSVPSSSGWKPPREILTGIRKEHRDLLLNWISLVCFESGMLTATLFATLETIDRILIDTSDGDVCHSKLQMVAGAVLIIQSTLRNQPIKSTTMKDYCADEYTIEEINSMTLVVLNTLRDKFFLPNIYEAVKWTSTGNIEHYNFHKLILAILVYSNEYVNISFEDADILRGTIEVMTSLFFSSGSDSGSDPGSDKIDVSKDQLNIITRILSCMDILSSPDGPFREALDALLKVFTNLSLSNVATLIRVKMDLPIN